MIFVLELVRLFLNVDVLESKANNIFAGEPYFEVLGETIEVSEVAKKVVKIRFGVSPPSPKAKVSKNKKGSDKRSARSKSSTSGGRKEKGAKSKKKVDRKHYVAKYNVMLGTYTVVKEIIIIGSFK